MDDISNDEQDVNDLIAGGAAQTSYEKYADHPISTSDKEIPEDVCKRGLVTPGTTYREFFSILFPR